MRELKLLDLSCDCRPGMFPVCAGIEKLPAPELFDLEMFPVCAGIEIATVLFIRRLRMFPVCAGIEILRLRSLFRLFDVSRVCGN